MTQPMHYPPGEPDGSEYSWGKGMFAPGVANNEGQSKFQDDFGPNMHPAMHADGQTLRDNHARAVADRRTDATDPASGRDFETLGNMDRYGAAPPLIRAQPEANVSEYVDIEFNRTPRGW